MKSLLKSLCESYGPSGGEDAVRKIILEQMKSTADEIRVDALGNVIAHKLPHEISRNSKRIMLTAHMDEIGVIVSHIDQNGFVRFANIGGNPGRYMTGARVQFLNGTVGILGNDQMHETFSDPPSHRMYIDVGAVSRDTCPVKVGDIGGFERTYIEMGERLVAKSLDDRAGVAVLIETLKKCGSPANEVFFVFTVQQKVGMRGTASAAFGVDPQIGIAVDLTHSGDVPSSPAIGIRLGEGPCIRVRDEEMIIDPRVVQWMAATAEKARIPYQREVLLSGSSEAGRMQISRAGVLAGAVTIPARYVHTTSEMIDFRDLKNAVKMLVELVRQPVHMQNVEWE